MLGARRWSVAAAVGAALGPAVGGLLTEAFDWRAIFAFQAPVALAALVAGWRAPDARGGSHARGPGDLRANVRARAALGRARRRAVPGRDPRDRGAGDCPRSPRRCSSRSCPRATLAAGRLRGRGAPTRRGCRGGARGRRARRRRAAPRAVGRLARGRARADRRRARSRRSAPLGGGARPGIRRARRVVGERAPPRPGASASLLVAPLLASGIDSASDRAAEAGAGVVLDAQISPRAKLELGVDIARTLADAPRASVPDFGSSFASARARDPRPGGVLSTARGSARRHGACRARARVQSVALGLRRARAARVRARSRGRRGGARRERPQPRTRAARGRDRRERRPRDRLARPRRTRPRRGRGSRIPAAPRPPLAAGGTSGTIERVVLDGLDGAACHLGVSRERLVVGLTTDRGPSAAVRLGASARTIGSSRPSVQDCDARSTTLRVGGSSTGSISPCCGQRPTICRSPS